MPNEDTQRKKVFISYSWTSPEHEQRVIGWAERLASDGVEVVLDKWDLQAGQDKYAFMEKMVTDPTVSKVLLLLDKAYAEKADARKGGVGTESQIISQEVYDKVDQNKFVPVVFETDTDGTPYLPTFLKSRIYFDFSSPESSNENYERLVRAIYDKPLHKKPALGRPPEYILKDNAPMLWPRPMLANYKDSLLQGKPSAKGYASQFLDTFFERLEDFRVMPKDGEQWDDTVVTSIEAFIPFRDSFVEFFHLAITWGNDVEFLELTEEFFEKSIFYLFRPPSVERWNDLWWDNYRFILYELYLYVITILLRNKRFAEVASMTDRPYYLPNNSNPGDDNFTQFTIFRAHCETFDHRNQRLKLQRLSLEADLLKQRATRKDVPFDQIMQAEGLLLLKSLVRPEITRPWYPCTLIYARYNRRLELFARAASRKQFDTLKKLLGVDSKDELMEKLKHGYAVHRVAQWYHFNYEGISFEHLWALEQLDTLA